MKPISKPLRRWAYRIGRPLIVAAAVLSSAYCSGPDDQSRLESLSVDEAHLVNTYVKITLARDEYSVSYLKADSLFAVLDSTTDTLRIANTIRELNKDPDRWLSVFQHIQRQLRKAKQGESQGREQGQLSEQTR